MANSEKLAYTANYNFGKTGGYSLPKIMHGTLKPNWLASYIVRYLNNTKGCQGRFSYCRWFLKHALICIHSISDYKNGYS